MGIINIFKKTYQLPWKDTFFKIKKERHVTISLTQRQQFYRNAYTLMSKRTMSQNMFVSILKLSKFKNKSTVQNRDKLI